MLRTAPRRVTAAIVLGAAGMVAPAWGAPAGRVIRVERDRTALVVPRLCELQPGQGQGLCIGAPAPGDRVAMLDPAAGRVLGEFRVETVEPATDAWLCHTAAPVLYKITGMVISGDPDAIEARRVPGLRGLRLTPSVARILKDVPSPSGRAGEEVQFAVDADGNDAPDVVLVQYRCDEQGQPSTSTDSRLCFDTYVERRRRLERVHQDVLQICL